MVVIESKWRLSKTAYLVVMTRMDLIKHLSGFVLQRRFRSRTANTSIQEYESGIKWYKSSIVVAMRAAPPHFKTFNSAL